MVALVALREAKAVVETADPHDNEQESAAILVAQRFTVMLRLAAVQPTCEGTNKRFFKQSTREVAQRVLVLASGGMQALVVQLPKWYSKSPQTVLRLSSIS